MTKRNNMKRILTATLLIIGVWSCNTVKKSTQKTTSNTEQGSTKEFTQLSNTIYTDTGSITTQYRDTFLFAHDTMYQPIDKVVYRWYRQTSLHDSFYIRQHDTVTITNTVTIAAKESKRASILPTLFFSIIGLIALIIGGVYLYKKFV